MKKTFIDIPFAYKDRAKQLGAKWDSYEERWFVEGEVPTDLLGFVPKTGFGIGSNDLGNSILKLTDSVFEKQEKVNHINIKKCPACGKESLLQKTIIGTEFYQCTDLQCKGQPVVKKNEQVRDISSTAEFSSVDEILEFALPFFKTQQEMRNWFSTPKLRLQKKTPSDVIKTISGRKAIKELLLELYS